MILAQLAIAAIIAGAFIYAVATAVALESKNETY